MVMKGFSYPSFHSHVVVFLNISSHFFISIEIYLVSVDLVESLDRLFITAKTVVENVLRSQLLNIVCMINEVVKEAHIRSDPMVTWAI